MGLAGASSSLVIEPSDQISLEAGETMELSLSVDELPDGLMGYFLTVELDDPDVARIENVDFPAWASPNDMSELPDSSVWLKAADLQFAVGEGAKDTELATLTLKGMEGGSTGITVTISRLDDESENAIILEKAEYPEEEEEEETGDENPPADESFESSRSTDQRSSSKVEISEDAESENPEESQDENSENQVTSQNPETESIENANVEVEDTGGNTLPGFGSALSASIFVIMGIVSRRSTKLRRK